LTSSKNQDARAASYFQHRLLQYRAKPRPQVEANPQHPRPARVYRRS